MCTYYPGTVWHQKALNRHVKGKHWIFVQPSFSPNVSNSRCSSSFSPCLVSLKVHSLSQWK
jgi:hypothetical protein